VSAPPVAGLSHVDLGASVYVQRSRHQVGYEVVEGPLKGGDGRAPLAGEGFWNPLEEW
jgi:hypothetical protein